MADLPDLWYRITAPLSDGNIVVFRLPPDAFKRFTKMIESGFSVHDAITQTLIVEDHVSATITKRTAEEVKETDMKNGFISYPYSWGDPIVEETNG